MELKKTNSGRQMYYMKGRSSCATKEAWLKIFKKMGWGFDESELIPAYEEK